jgi:GNAT superfamily N-acetyltransferase
VSAPASYQVVAARREHFAALREAEREAEKVFPPEDFPAALHGATLASDEELAEAMEQGLLWAALDSRGAAVGFAIALWLGGDLHLDELDVHPAHQRRGVGRMLVGAVRAHAERCGAERLTLTTFTYVPWNMPWYARLGFVALAEDAMPPLLREIYEEEIARGLPRARRVAMALRLGA